MEYFGAEQKGRTFVLRLDQGDLLLESINALIEREGLRYGVVLSGIGTLDQSVMHMVTTTGYPPVEFFDQREDQALELVSIDGFIADGVPHLHMTVSDREKAYAGHLENGCRVLYLAEVVIQELSGISVRRVRDENNILKLKDL
jgi:predicted DNA-binding protein with PD1-like motif